MQLVRLKINNIGPFVDAEVTFEEDVTVITGRNDTGKSSLLKVIEMVCAKDVDTTAGESDVNFDYLVSSATDWRNDLNVNCVAEFRYTPSPTSPLAIYRVYPAPECWKQSVLELPASGVFRGKQALEYLPRILKLGGREDEGIRHHIYLTDPNRTERKFLEVAFGSDYSFQSLSSLNDQTYESALTRAEERLNKRLQSFLPPGFSYRLRFRHASDKRNLLLLNVVDHHDASTSITQRGTGVQKIINLLGMLAIENLGDKPLIILFDEPENSLHADSQHVLRRILEAIASRKNVQVIYSTHSPCMVNSIKPKSIRLLERETRNHIARSVVRQDCFADNYALVRSSLGISPADSLLYAPISVVVSGKTEVLCLPMLLQRLERSDKSFEGVSILLSQCIFIEAGGDSNMKNLSRIATAQGSEVIVFGDGDTGRRWIEQMKEVYPDRLVVLPHNEEFEDLVSPMDYFKTLATHYKKPEISEESFNTWSQNKCPNQKSAFTKRIDRWLIDAFDLRGLEKADIMYEAITGADLGNVKKETLFKLVERMRMLMPR